MKSAKKFSIIMLALIVSGVFFSCRKKGPKIQAKSVVPKSNPIVRFIVVEGRRAIAMGIPRNDVLPIRPASCKV